MISSFPSWSLGTGFWTLQRPDDEPGGARLDAGASVDAAHRCIPKLKLGNQGSEITHLFSE
jgi:hypothetical protein